MISNIGIVVKRLADTIFTPVIDMLNRAGGYLRQIRLQPERAIKLDYYLGPVSMMGPEWIMLVKSVIGAIALLTLIFACKSIYGLYLKFKNGVKWW